jgi:hypothetical protein
MYFRLNWLPLQENPLAVMGLKGRTGYFHSSFSLKGEGMGEKR